jgi:glycosyltransferase involved in cell wall biosynthesis
LNNKWIIKIAYAVEKFLYKKAKLINVLTPAFYNTLRDKKDISISKLIMIPNAADFSLSEDILTTFDRDLFRKQHSLEGKFVITYVGAHGVANHLEQILQAGKALEDTNVMFLLIGQGMEKARLIKLAEKMEVKNVRFIDSVPKKEVFKYIIASEMGASVLKRVDTFKTVYSNKTFDYFSCKKPILMAIDGVSRELVETADAGVFVEPEKPEDFALKIRAYLTQPGKAKNQGENGYEYAKENFDRIVLANKYLDLVREKLIDKNV